MQHKELSRCGRSNITVQKVYSSNYWIVKYFLSNIGDCKLIIEEQGIDIGRPFHSPDTSVFCWEALVFGFQLKVRKLK